MKEEKKEMEEPKRSGIGADGGPGRVVQIYIRICNGLQQCKRKRIAHLFGGDKGEEGCPFIRCRLGQ